VARLERLAFFVPRGVHSLGIECRLRAGAHPVDLGAALTRVAGGLDERALARERPEIGRALASEPRWRAIARFGQRWAKTGSASRAWIPFVFLEYDASATEPPVPSVFAALDSPIGEAGSRGCPELAAARELAGALLGDAFDAKRSDRLEQCFGALQGEARILHVAAMLGRSPPSVRLSAWIAESQAYDYFEAIGARAAGEKAERLLALLPERPAYCQLDFDLGPPVAPSVGLGCRPEHRDRWRELLDRLVAEGLCDPDKAVAVLCWPGSHVGAGVRLRRELSHVKLGCDPGGRVEAKCYFGATPAPETDGEPTAADRAAVAARFSCSSAPGTR